MNRDALLIGKVLCAVCMLTFAFAQNNPVPPPEPLPQIYWTHGRVGQVYYVDQYPSTHDVIYLVITKHCDLLGMFCNGLLYNVNHSNYLKFKQAQQTDQLVAFDHYWSEKLHAWVLYGNVTYPYSCPDEPE